VVAKGYLTKLLANPAVKSYIERHEPEILSHLELVANTVSMEEAVQQQQGEANDSVIAGFDPQSMTPASLV
jgi:Mn-containing catalase